MRLPGEDRRQDGVPPAVFHLIKKLRSRLNKNVPLWMRTPRLSARFFILERVLI